MSNEISILYAINESMNEAQKGNKPFKEIVDKACEITGAKRCSIMVLDKEYSELTIAEARGISESVIRETKIPLGKGIAGEVALNKTPLLIKNLDRQTDVHHNGYEYNNKYASNSLVCLPLMIKDKVFGVLNVTDKKNGKPFTKKEVSLLSVLVQRAALIIENNALYESIFKNVMDTLQSLVMTLEAKDPYTLQHSQRVTTIALQIAQIIGCSEEEKNALAMACPIHDIGKIGIKDSILAKPGKLTFEEFEHIKRHPLIGEDILSPLGFFSQEQRIIRNHHERWDGRGYPDSLHGNEIPFLARIVTVADSYDAITSDRPYRKAKTQQEAFSELINLSNQQFDADIVHAFMEVVNLTKK
ncbi:MAG: HD domain-containing protein [Thermodesulfobacteriota bacterium]|nr:HD domain-containing protein [Thermodesulfobacteriota bacterium]